MHPTDPPPGPPQSPGTEPVPRQPLPKYGEATAPQSGRIALGPSEQPYYGPPPYGYPGQEPPPNQKTSTVATLALVFGAIGAIPVAIVLGIVALARIPSTRQKGKGLAIAGIALACVWVVVFVLIGLDAGSDPVRDASGQVTTKAAVPHQDLRVGDCVARVDEGAVRDLEVRPCSGPNGGRVFAVFELPAGTFPGEEPVQTTAQNGCGDRWLEQGGKGTDPVSIVTMFPVEASWKLGDHRVTCLLTPQ
ncbi:DUF4190 domain-containing protein [Kribbella endophytica]